MAVFSTNQNRQFYVANKVEEITETSKTGAIEVKCINDGVDKELYFLYKGADTVLRSDRIQLKNLNYVKGVKAEDLRDALKSIVVSLNPDVNDGNPVVGQDYILRIAFRQFYGMSDEDQYFKDAAVHVTKAIAESPEKFYEALAKSLNQNFSREVGATKDSNPYLSFTASADGLTITEKPQDWTLGIGTQERVYFEVYPTTIYTDGDDVYWAKQDETTGKFYEDKTPTDKSSLVVDGDAPTGLGNGKKIADLEWFCMGERGDQYRLAGWPNYIPTKYLVDPDKEYNVLELHFAFTDTGVNSYRSEKDITIVSDDASVIDSLIGEINSKAGLSIESLGGGSDGSTPEPENP